MGKTKKIYTSTEICARDSFQKMTKHGIARHSRSNPFKNGCDFLVICYPEMSPLWNGLKIIRMKIHTNYRYSYTRFCFKFSCIFVESFPLSWFFYRHFSNPIITKRSSHIYVTTSFESTLLYMHAHARGGAIVTGPVCDSLLSGFRQSPR